MTLYFNDVMHPNQSPQVSQLRQADGNRAKTLEVSVISFGYKEGPPPLANMVFDVRFLKNPFWVPELRPLTGLDQPVQDYVLKQPWAMDFLDSLSVLLNSVLPRFAELELSEFSIAFGFTGGQHRSADIVEALAERIAVAFPHFQVNRVHRQLKSGMAEVSAFFRDEDGVSVDCAGTSEMPPETVTAESGASPGCSQDTEHRKESGDRSDSRQ